MRVMYVDTEGGYSYKIIGDAIKKYLPLVPDIEYKLANHKKTESRHIDGFQPDWCLTSTPLNNHSYIIKNQRNWFSVGYCTRKHAQVAGCCGGRVHRSVPGHTGAGAGVRCLFHTS